MFVLLTAGSPIKSIVTHINEIPQPNHNKSKWYRFKVSVVCAFLFLFGLWPNT